MTMYRSAFEKICDALASMESSLHEGLQWACAALFIGLACLVVVRAFTAA